MSKSVFIDPLAFAKNRQQMQTELALAELDERVRSMLANTDGVCAVSLSGMIDEKERPALELAIDTTLHVECQRCLGALEYPLHSQSTIVLYADEATMDAAMDEDDDLDAILIEPQIDVVQLVEDEIIMGLPFAPKHEQCDSAHSNQHSGRENPFAVLAALKKDVSE